MSPQPPLFPGADRHRLEGHLPRLLFGMEIFQDAYEQLQDIDCGLSPGTKHVPQGQIGSAGPGTAMSWDLVTIFLELVWSQAY